jgi:hypothetical protein
MWHIVINISAEMDLAQNKELNMRAIISGKLYDTSKSTQIAEKIRKDDMKQTTMILYITKNNNYFFAICHKYSSGNIENKIEISAQEQALNWCEKQNIDVDIILQHFQIEQA